MIGTIIPEFDAISDDHGLNTAIGRSTVLPMIIRVRLLAGLAVVMKTPLEQLSRLCHAGTRLPNSGGRDSRLL